MQINSKNIAIMLLMFFLISNQIIGIAWGILKAFLYCTVFLFLIKRISPEMYNYLIKLFNLDEFRLSNIPASIISILKKLKSLIPIFKKDEPQKDKVTSESS